MSEYAADASGFDIRRRRAIAQCDLMIDVYSAWIGRYADDDWHAGIDWIMAVIPTTEGGQGEDRWRGWLCVSGTGTPAIGWRLEEVWQVGSICGSMRGTRFVDLTRGQFRAAAKASGACLPSRHATLYLFDEADPWLSDRRPRKAAQEVPTQRAEVPSQAVEVPSLTPDIAGEAKADA